MSNENNEHNATTTGKTSAWTPFLFFLLGAAIPLAAAAYFYWQKHDSLQTGHTDTNSTMRQLATANPQLLPLWRMETRRDPTSATNDLIREAARAAVIGCNQVQVRGSQETLFGTTVDPGMPLLAVVTSCDPLFGS